VPCVSVFLEGENDLLVLEYHTCRMYELYLVLVESVSSVERFFVMDTTVSHSSS
jgi:hypothetical protein